MKNVLIITYYWPPGGGAGVQRWLKFSRLLPQHGWNPVIITPKNGDYPNIDNSLLELVPKDMKVIRTKSTNFSKIFSTYSRSFKICKAVNVS